MQMSCNVLAFHYAWPCFSTFGDVLPCHVEPRHFISASHLMSCHAMSVPAKEHATPIHAIFSGHFMQCHFTSFHVLPCHDMAYHVMRCRIKSCPPMPRDAPPWQWRQRQDTDNDNDRLVQSALCAHKSNSLPRARVHGPWPLPCLANLLATCRKDVFRCLLRRLVPLGMKWACSC